jgi:UDP-N-acetylglucosamine--N-acetylmuramyl-(pentapeptide) pyrophosphoryl-undecaprenol N-acetylglucosamine transferase
MSRFAIAAGGTGGHLFPGLAVAEILHKEGHEVMVLTSEKQIDVVATEGRSEFRIERLPGMGMPRGFSPATFRFFGRFAAGVLHCRRLFSEFQPAAVLGMGGFTSTAPILAGRLRGLPVFVHESNVFPGKANRLNGRISGGLLVGFQEAQRHSGKLPCTFTGTPVRRALQDRHLSKSEALQSFGLGHDLPTILVMGGSQGATGINMAVMEAAAHLGPGRLQFIHITGQTDESAVRAFYQKMGIPAWTGAFHHAMQDAYCAADLSVARSGAASLTELAFFGVPSILIPYPYAADDHQTFNARVFADAGAAVLMPEREASAGSLLREISRILEDKGCRQSMAEKCAALSIKDAAEQVAHILLRAVEGGGK